MWEPEVEIHWLLQSLSTLLFYLYDYLGQECDVCVTVGTRSTAASMWTPEDNLLKLSSPWVTGTERR